MMPRGSNVRDPRLLPRCVRNGQGVPRRSCSPPDHPRVAEKVAEVLPQSVRPLTPVVEAYISLSSSDDDEGNAVQSPRGRSPDWPDTSEDSAASINPESQPSDTICISDEEEGAARGTSPEWPMDEHDSAATDPESTPEYDGISEGESVDDEFTSEPQASQGGESPPMTPPEPEYTDEPDVVQYTVVKEETWVVTVNRRSQRILDAVSVVRSVRTEGPGVEVPAEEFSPVVEEVTNQATPREPCVPALMPAADDEDILSLDCEEDWDVPVMEPRTTRPAGVSDVAAPDFHPERLLRRGYTWNG